MIKSLVHRLESNESLSAITRRFRGAAHVGYITAMECKLITDTSFNEDDQILTRCVVFKTKSTLVHPMLIILTLTENDNEGKRGVSIVFV